MDKLKPLILGDGILGTEIHNQTDWDIISRKKNGFDINGDFTDFLIDNGRVKTNILINCIANTDTYSKEREQHWNVNYVFVHKLILFCNFWKIKLVHISTDYVYTNSVTNASENDVPVHCNNWYGYTKLLGDGLVQLLSDNYLLIRCTHKPNPFPYKKAWIDQVGNFDYVDKISTLIVEMIEKDFIGLYNVGTELKNISDLSKKTSNSTPSFAPDFVPKNTSMDLTKMLKDLEKKS